MGLKAIKGRTAWAILLGASLAVGCSVESAQHLGPHCAEYLGATGCCLKAAGDNQTAVAACQELAETSRISPDPAQAEASCKAANDAVAAAGLCAPRPPVEGDKVPSMDCERYLACIVKVSPDAFPAALMSYGPRSPCWDSPTLAAQCTTACQGSLANLRQLPAAPAHPECLTCAEDKDCFSALPACDVARKICVRCTSDAHCMGAAEGPACSAETKRCAECNSDAQCRSRKCEANRCALGCFIDGAYRAPGSANPMEPCQSCLPGVSPFDWSPLMDGTSCGAGLACQRGSCVQRFSLQTNPTTASIRAVWGSGRDDVYAVGGSQTILRTTDRGKTWEVKSSGGFIGSLRSVWGSGRDDVYAAGSLPWFLLRSTNSGATWTARDAPMGSTFYDVWGSGRDDIYAVGRGLILRTTDSGATWTPQMSGTTVQLSAAWGSGRDDVYVVGDDGTILHTTDSGKTWTSQMSGTTDDLSGVWGSGRDDVYAIGGFGTVLRTTDGGRTWVKLTRASLVLLTDVWGSGRGDFYVVGTGGTIVHTKDGGMSWRRELSDVPDDLSGVWGSGRDDVYVVGSGKILHYP